MMKYCWVIAACAVFGFTTLSAQAALGARDMYTAYATMYVYTNSPNVTNYGYANGSDLSTAVRLVDTYKVVIRSNKVMDAVVDRLNTSYPDLTNQYIVSTLSMGTEGETGVLRIACTTPDPQMSADICNGVVEFAPPEIIRVVGVGSIEVIDYAEVPERPNPRSTLRNGLIGGLAGAVLACAVLLVMFLLNRKVRDAKELNDYYTLPVLAEVPRSRKLFMESSEALLNENSRSSSTEAYNKLRMNLSFALLDKRHVILVSSAVPGEGKTTIAANLAITYARSGKRVLLIDGDMRRGNQTQVFAGKVDEHRPGLSNLIIGEYQPEDVIVPQVYTNLDLLLSGSIPPNPAELLSSGEMMALLDRLEKEYGYEVIIVDTPPINVVSDPLVLSGESVGMLYVVRQNYSDHRELRKAFAAADLSGINLLGMVLYGENVNASRYKGRYYRKYYERYDRNARERDEHENRKWELHSGKKG